VEVGDSLQILIHPAKKSFSEGEKICPKITLYGFISRLCRLDGEI
jgi:hypothetical protein